MLVRRETPSCTEFVNMKFAVGKPFPAYSPTSLFLSCQSTGSCECVSERWIGGLLFLHQIFLMPARQLKSSYLLHFPLDPLEAPFFLMVDGGV